MTDSFWGAFSFARVYSCSEQFDAALISNYDILGVEEVVNFACSLVRERMISYFVLPTNSSHSIAKLRIITEYYLINRCDQRFGNSYKLTSNNYKLITIVYWYWFRLRKAYDFILLLLGSSLHNVSAVELISYCNADVNFSLLPPTPHPLCPILLNQLLMSQYQEKWQDLKRYSIS